MTRDRANEILFLHKVGAEIFPFHVITTALYITGDLVGPTLEADPGLVRVPSLPAWVEGSCLVGGEGASQRAPGVLLEAAESVD